MSIWWNIAGKALSVLSGVLSLLNKLIPSKEQRLGKFKERNKQRKAHDKAKKKLNDVEYSDDNDVDDSLRDGDF